MCSSFSFVGSKIAIKRLLYQGKICFFNLADDVQSFIHHTSLVDLILQTKFILSIIEKAQAQLYFILLPFRSFILF